MTPTLRCWLVKSEPDCFSIQHLAKLPGQTTCWSGVRNYQARNFMRDDMKRGDRVLFYHSSADPSAVVGTAVVVREGYPDHTAWDKADDHYDSKASAQNPIWQMVDIRLEEIFDQPVTLPALRAVSGLKEMELLRKGSRLSVQPVRPREFEIVVGLARAGTAAPATNKPRQKKSTPARSPAVSKSPRKRSPAQR